MTANIDLSSGIFMLLARDGINYVSYPILMKNNLWYHYLDNILPYTTAFLHKHGTSIIQHM